MAKPENPEETEEVPEESPKEKPEKKVSIVQDPIEFQQLFQTPDGVMDMTSYLVWMGNILVELREGITG